MEPKQLSEEEIQGAVYNAITEAVDFVETEIAPDRIDSQKYFDGQSKIEYEDGRSKVVATKVRDTIRAIKPSLMRVFLQSDKPVEFLPRNPQGVQGAEQATNYARYVFERNNGFSVLQDVFHDALIKKTGVAKVYYDESVDVQIDEYRDIDQQVLALIESDPEIEVIEREETIEVEAQVDPMTGIEIAPAFYKYSVKVAKTNKRGQIKIDTIAPEDFFVDRMAVTLEDSYVCGHASEARVGDLVAMGYDFDTVYRLSGDGDSTVDDEEELARRGWDDNDDNESMNDPSMRKVLYTEAFMRMDIDGNGIPRLYKFICAGTSYEVLDYELCDYIPFAIFEVDPEPHTFYGRSLAEIIVDDQDTATSMLRGLLDSIAMANNPRMMCVQSQVNIDDLLNNEIGGIVRVKDINAMREFNMGGGASAVLPALQFYDEVVRAKTGVSGAAMGLDADALQSQTAAGVNAAVQAATAVSELIARNLAEGGMKQLFKLIVQIARQNPDPQEMIRLNGFFVPVDPQSWSNDLDLITNVGLGNNQREERMAALQQALQTQIQVYGQYGAQNGLVSMTNIRNTLSDILGFAGIHNADRYYQPMNPQIEQQLQMMAMQQAQMQGQGQGQGMDQAQAYMQAEGMKAQTRAQVDMQKAVMEHQRKIMEMASSDDLKRDEMAQKLLTDAAKILGQYGTQVDVARIQQEQMMPRQGQMMPGQMMPGQMMPQ